MLELVLNTSIMIVLIILMNTNIANYVNCEFICMVIGLLFVVYCRKQYDKYKNKRYETNRKIAKKQITERLRKNNLNLYTVSLFFRYQEEVIRIQTIFNEKLNQM